MNMIQETIKRAKAETPVFFKKVQYICATLGAIGGVLVAVPASVIVLPASVVTIGGYLIVAGLVGGAIAKTTVKDASELEESK